MRKFSGFALAREAMRGHKGWGQQWGSPEPRKEYDVIIIGAGGHGLATAYYLAKEHGVTNVAVLEKGWLGGGNTGRNTTIIRSNYLYDQSAALYDHAVKLWENLAQDLNYNVMFSPRGVMMLAHNVHDVQVFKRHIHANRLNGVDNEWLTPEQAKEYCPPLNISQAARYPVMGAALQRRGGTARHDAV
ncbi:MAG: FAD-dependent oxidoreductase, partial [Oricola sp.]